MSRGDSRALRDQSAAAVCAEAFSSTLLVLPAKSSNSLRTLARPIENPKYSAQAEAARTADAERWREISVSADFDGPKSLAGLQF
jgi:hypothetical protein